MTNETIYVFFDVDETVIKIKSMFDFLDFFVRKENKQSLWIRRKVFLFMMRVLVFFHFKRSVINRAYYYFFCKQDQESILEYGNQWFLSHNDKNFFYQEIIKKIKNHQENGDVIVLVSGSLFACLWPIAKYLNIKHILCCQQKIDRHGRLTGRIDFPLIGQRKKIAINAFLRDREINPNICIAYADDISDLPMLGAVGKAVVIPSSNKLLKIAKQRNWEVIDKNF